MASSGVKAGGFGNPWGGSFRPVNPRGPLHLGPGQGNVRFTGGPVRASAPKAYSTAPPSTAAAPAAAPAAPPATPSPYDALYFNQLAQATNAANQRIASLNANIANGQTNLTSTLAQLAHNQVLAQQKAQLDENSRGGFAQGILGQTEGRIGQQYLTQETNDQTKYSQNKAAWEQAIAGIQQGLPLTQIALGLASAGRVAALGLQAPPDTSSAPTSLTPQQVAYINAGMSGPPKFKSTAPEKRSGSKRGKGSYVKPGGWKG